MPGWTCVCGARDLRWPACPVCGRRPWWEMPAAQPWVPPVPRPKAGPLVRAMSAILVLLFVAGVAALDARTEELGRARRDRLRAAVAAAMPELQDYVASMRGRPFRAPVSATLLGDRAFEDALREDTGTTPDEPEEPGDFGETMLALRLAASGEDPYDADSELDADVTGFYDNETGHLYVRGSRLTAYSRLVLVHELVHAWQDQHFDLSTLMDAAKTDDARRAVAALVEGDATVVEDAWRADQPAEVRAEIDAAESSGGAEPDTRAGQALALLYGFPYSVGPSFVEALTASGGNAALDAAFAAPPTSTEHVIHPATYLAREKPETVTRESGVPGEVVDRGVLGEAGLFVVLSSADPSAEALAAARGWSGDAYVTWLPDGADDSPCTAVRVRMDSAAELAELRAYLRLWDVRPSVTVLGPRGLRFEICAE